MDKTKEAQKDMMTVLSLLNKWRLPVSVSLRDKIEQVQTTGKKARRTK